MALLEQSRLLYSSWNSLVLLLYALRATTIIKIDQRKTSCQPEKRIYLVRTLKATSAVPKKRLSILYKIWYPCSLRKENHRSSIYIVMLLHGKLTLYPARLSTKYVIKIVAVVNASHGQFFHTVPSNLIPHTALNSIRNNGHAATAVVVKLRTIDMKIYYNFRRRHVVSSETTQMRRIKPIHRLPIHVKVLSVAKIQVFVHTCALLQKRPFRWTWIRGQILLLVIWMCAL